MAASADPSQLINRRSPRLILVWEIGQAPLLILDVVRTPPVSLPIRLAIADIDGSTARPTGLFHYLAGGIWILRANGQPARFADAQAVLRRPGGVTTTAGDHLSWDLSGFGDHLRQVRVACGVSA